MKKYLIALLGCILIFLVACSDSGETNGTNSDDVSNNNNNEGQNQGADTEEVELTFTIWGNDAHTQMYEDVLAQFYEENPGIKVNIQSIPFADYQQKLSVFAAGNELPDIGWVSEQMVPQFKENGILEDISDFGNDEDFDLDDFIPSTLELWTEGDKLLGLPFSTPPMIMYFNKTMFEEAGLETPLELAKKGEWTWEQMEEAAKALSKGEGADRDYGARFFTDWTNFSTLPSHTISYGGSMFNDDITDFTWNSPQGVDTFEMLDRMMFEDKSHVPPGENVNFEGGKVGMYTGMYSYISNVRGITDFEWDIAPLPKGPEGRAPLLGMAGMVAFTGSEHPEEAKKLLKFIQSKTGIQAQSAFFVPPRRSVLESDAFMNIPNNPPKESIQIAMIDQMNEGYMYPLHEDWTKIQSEIVNGFDKLFSQVASPEEILEEMEKNVDPLLK
ncbi:ABC transporter substrate-binding protein [Radiobacillus sp. PE A8.2]|uniref:ABC transporter substrate-binding protein n=1 Tax=Radiobacillus sp. PE A8.2 TaxID=3380349 RepID=UPI00388FD5F9